jgi:hypothetical protein
MSDSNSTSICLDLSGRNLKPGDYEWAGSYRFDGDQAYKITSSALMSKEYLSGQCNPEPSIGFLSLGAFVVIASFVLGFIIRGSSR